jgi:hypothetical protein
MYVCIYVINVCVFCLPGYTEYIKSSYICGSLDVTNFIYLGHTSKSQQQNSNKNEYKRFYHEFIVVVVVVHRKFYFGTNIIYECKYKHKYVRTGGGML